MYHISSTNTQKIIIHRTSYVTPFLLWIILFLFFVVSPTHAQTNPSWKDKYDKVQESRYINGVIVKKNDRWGLVDKQSGKIIIPLAYDRVAFSERMIKVYQNGKVGVFTHAGHQLIPTEYEDVITPQNTQLLFLKKDGKWETKNNGIEAVNIPLHDDVKVLNLGYTTLLKEGKWAIYNAQGKAATPYQFDHIRINSSYSPIYIVEINNKKGLIRYDGEELIPPIYTQLIDQGKGIYLVEKDQKIGLVNKINRVLLPIEYEQIIKHAYQYSIVRE